MKKWGLVLSIMLVCGCAAMSGTVNNHSAVRVISNIEASECRPVSPIIANSDVSPSDDQQRNAIEHALALTVEKGGNALTIDQIVFIAGQNDNHPTVVRVTGQAYQCG